MRIQFYGLLALVLSTTGACGARSNAPGEGGERVQGGILKLAPGNPKLEFVKIEPVEESSAASAITLTGKVDFDEDHTQRVASPIDGRATALLVRPGDVVKAGASLVGLSSPRVGQLQSDAQKALADMSVAQKAVDRAHKLAADGAISDKEVAQLESEFNKAKSEVGRTAAQLRSLGLSAGDPTTDVTLRAQIGGTVVERNVLTGQEVRSDGAAPLLTISNLGSVWVLADVYEADLGAVTLGAQVRVQVPAYPSEWFPGKVGHVGDVVDASSRTVKIRCVVANADGRLKPEMFAKIEIQSVGDRKAIYLSTHGIINDGDQSKVVVAGAGNTFHTRTVQVGPSIDGRVRILDGLKVGERVVTEGALFLKQELDTN